MLIYGSERVFSGEQRMLEMSTSKPVRICTSKDLIFPIKPVSRAAYHGGGLEIPANQETSLTASATVSQRTLK